LDYLVFPSWRCALYGKLVSALYVLNIVFQAFITLLIPVGLCFLVGWLLVTYAACPPWVYAPLLVVGVLVGFYSMIKFVLTAMAGFERLEKEIKTSKLSRDKRNETTRKWYSRNKEENDEEK